MKQFIVDRFRLNLVSKILLYCKWKKYCSFIQYDKSLCPSVHLNLHPAIRPSCCLTTHFSARPVCSSAQSICPLHPSIQSVCLSFLYLSVCLTTYLFISLFICSLSSMYVHIYLFMCHVTKRHTKRLPNQSCSEISD